MRQNEKRKTLWPLFVTFFRIGAFTFGGGYAMIPLVQREVAEKRKWVTDDDILEILAIAESTPGPIAVNMATFVGYRMGGVLGAALATAGVVLPSILIISVIALLLRQFADLTPVRYAFYGIRAGVLALLVKAVWSMAKKCPRKPVAIGIALAAFLVSALTDIHVLLIIVVCAVAGLVWTNLRRKEEK